MLKIKERWQTLIRTLENGVWALIQISETLEKLMAAVDNFNTAFADLKTKVEAFIAANQGGASEAQVQAFADQVTALAAEVPAGS